MPHPETPPTDTPPAPSPPSTLGGVAARWVLGLTGIGVCAYVSVYAFRELRRTQAKADRRAARLRDSMQWHKAADPTERRRIEREEKEIEDD